MSWSNLPLSRRRALRLAVFARDRHLCQLAYPGICTMVATVADHVRPRETHGDGLDNLQAACAPCNGHKGRPGSRDPGPEPVAGAWW